MYFYERYRMDMLKDWWRPKPCSIEQCGCSYII